MCSVAAYHYIASPLVGLHLLLSLASVTNSQNVTVSSFYIAPEENANFSCPEGSSVVNIRSYYDFQTHDRHWQFDCSTPTPAEPHPLNLVLLGWLNSYNELGGTLHYVCPGNSLLSGVDSSFYGAINQVDRVWQIQCLQIPEQLYVISDCEWTELSNPVDDISVAGVVAGLHSTYFFHALDRRWKFLTCSLDTVYCEELPTLPHGNASPPNGSAPYPSTVQFECNDGFYLEGPLSANCTEEREWTEIPTCKECSSIAFCAELVCTAENGSTCRQCDLFSPSGLTLVLDKEENSCRAPPIITQNGSTLITFEVGDTIVIPCEAKGIPSPHITWLKNGWLLEVDSPQIHFHDYHMTIDSITYLHTGVYQCVATNRVGSDNTTIELIGNNPPPYSPPTVVDWKSVHLFTVDHPGWLHCSALGFPPPEFSWSRKRLTQTIDLPETGDNSSRTVQYSNGTLKFTQVAHSDNGLYTCEISNGVEATLRQTVIHVHDPTTAPSQGESAARITVWRSEYSVVDGGSVLLLCGSAGFPPPEWVWLTEEGCMLESLPNGSLALSNVSVAQGWEQRFQCIVWNEVGLEERYTTVTVLEKAVVIEPTHTFGVATVTPTLFPSSSSPSVPSHLLSILLLLCFSV